MSPAPVVVVGAGLSGLAAARRARELGREVIVFEKSRGVGGRLATRRVGNVPVDHGCPILDIDARGDLSRVVAGLGSDAACPLSGTTAQALSAGMTSLAKALATGLDVRRGVRVGALRRGGSGVDVADDAGSTLARASSVILSAPAPQSAQLLHSAGEADRAHALAGCGYEPAVVILAGYRSATRSGVIGEEGPFTRIVREDEKGRRTVGGEVVIAAQMNPSTSSELFAAHDDVVAAEALPALTSAIGSDGDARWWQVKRWRYATPIEPHAEEGLWDVGGPILLCGDSLTGLDLDAVYASGVRAGEGAVL
jgi:renalase